MRFWVGLIVLALGLNFIIGEILRFNELFRGSLIENTVYYGIFIVFLGFGLWCWMGKFWMNILRKH